MAKATFRRLAVKDPTVFILSLNFVVAGLFFVIGSVLFWPGLDKMAGTEEDEVCLTMGATLFIIGSAMYVWGAGIDYVKMGRELANEAHEAGDMLPETPRSSQPMMELETMNPRLSEVSTEDFMVYESNNQDAEPVIERRKRDGSVTECHEATTEELRQMNPGERNTILYKRFIVKCQRLNCLMYCSAAVVFVLGSFFFLPQAHKYVPNKNIHGCWLFMVGSAVSMCGAYIGAQTAQELGITAPKANFPFAEHEKRARHMWWLTDEEVTYRSCWSYMCGCISFIFGTAFFFPSETEDCFKAGTILFVIGSLLFLLGATMDYMCLERSFFEGDTAPVPATPREAEDQGLVLEDTGEAADLAEVDTVEGKSSI